jgi:hypothetical protein
MGACIVINTHGIGRIEVLRNQRSEYQIVFTGWKRRIVSTICSRVQYLPVFLEDRAAVQIIMQGRQYMQQGGPGIVGYTTRQ